MKKTQVQYNHYQEKMATLILESGGTLDDSGLFVIKPGCAILNMTMDTEKGQQLYELLNIDTSRPTYEQRAEFKSRITYLSFNSSQADGRQYNKKMAQEYQHLSVHSSTYIEFLIAGVTIETCLEFVAHSEARVARLTSSKTKAMDESLYRLQGNKSEMNAQKQFVLNFIQLKSTFENQSNSRSLSVNGTEFTNMLNLCIKVNAFTYGMNLKDYHKLFIGRLSTEGNEQEVQEVCIMMCEHLHNHFPLVIRDPQYYYDTNTGKKYSVT